MEFNVNNTQTQKISDKRFYIKFKLLKTNVYQ